MVEKKDKRFVVKEEQGYGMGAINIVVDTITGVNYIVTIGSSVSGIIPLLDHDGHVVIDK